MQIETCSWKTIFVGPNDLHVAPCEQTPTPNRIELVQSLLKSLYLRQEYFGSTTLEQYTKYLLICWPLLSLHGPATLYFQAQKIESET